MQNRKIIAAAAALGLVAAGSSSALAATVQPGGVGGAKALIAKYSKEPRFVRTLTV